MQKLQYSTRYVAAHHFYTFSPLGFCEEAQDIWSWDHPQAPFTRGRILGRNWTKVLTLKNFPPCFSQSPLLTDFTPASHPLLKWFATICNVNIVLVCGNFNSEDYRDNAQKPWRNSTFMNAASSQVNPHLLIDKVSDHCPPYSPILAAYYEYLTLYKDYVLNCMDKVKMSSRVYPEICLESSSIPAPFQLHFCCRPRYRWVDSNSFYLVAFPYHDAECVVRAAKVLYQQNIE